MGFFNGDTHTTASLQLGLKAQKVRLGYSAFYPDTGNKWSWYRVVAAYSYQNSEFGGFEADHHYMGVEGIANFMLWSAGVGVFLDLGNGDIKGVVEIGFGF